VVILLITALGIAASLIPAVRKLRKSFELGMYLIMVFCMVVASMADISKISFESLYLLFYVILVVFGSMLIHAVLCRLFRIDTDTFLVTSTAFICNPALVPAVTVALKNRQVLFSGLIVGVIGFAIGNYLGVIIAWILA
jgi:uncharacterized membrane protein